VNQALVSVVIPTYNKALFIEQTVRSVLNQTYLNLEILLVDNGSTDGTRDILRKLESDHRNVRYLQTSRNLGPSGARNLGIQESIGKYIFFLDGDDLMFPTKLEKQISFMDANPLVGLSLTSYLISDMGVTSPRLISFRDIDQLLKGWFSMKGFGGSVESTGCIRVSLLNQDLMFDESLMGSEGLDFTWKWAQSFVCCVYKEPLTLYRKSDNQLHFDTEAIRENMSRISQKYFDKKELDTLLKLQSSFFNLNSLRSKRFSKVIFGLFQQLSLNVFRMSFAIVFRNLIARTKGKVYSKELRSLILSVQ
jgi:glycosyltransferase involved in cell wall biosynthesis